VVLATGRASGQPAATPARPPEVWAIVVGIGDYANPAIPDGRSSVRDAQAVRRWMQRAGWDNRHQLLLSDFGSAEPGTPAAPAANILPSRQNLGWAFERWILENRAQAGDLVVFYFAGESRSVARRQGTQLDVRHYLLPQDAEPEQLEQTGWSLEEAVDRCVREKLRVVCWLATAPGDPRGAAPVPRAAAAAGPVQGSSSAVAWLSRLARWPGVTAWLASDRPRPAGAVEAADPGRLFTQALLQALGGSGPGRAGDRRPNLAACLRDLHQDPQLERQGFRSMGGVPPSLTLWPVDIGQVLEKARPELVIQAGHADRVTAMAFPADGRLIATAAIDSTVRIWSAPDRSLLRVLAGQTVGATALALTRDDRWLISGGGRGTVLVHDRRNDFRPVPLAAGQPHVAGIRQIALLPDGLHFVSVDADGRGSLWDPSRSPLSPRPWPEGVGCREVAVGGRADPDGRDTGLVAALGVDGAVRIFDSAGGGGAVRDLARQGPATIAVSPDGNRLAAGYDDGQVIIHDLGTGAKDEYRAAGRPSAVQRLVFSPAGLLAIGHRSGLRLIGFPTTPPAAPGAAQVRPVFDLLDRHPPQHLAFSPGGTEVAACTEERGALRVWRIAGDGPPAVVLDDPSAEASLLGFTGNGRGLAVADVRGGLEFRPLDPAGDEVPWAFPPHRGKIQQLSATPSRQFLLFLDEQRTARIWDLKERTCRRLPGTYRAGAFLDDDRLVLIPDAGAAEHAGRPILADRSGRPAAAPSFAERAEGFMIPDGIPFERVVVSEDGRRIAAAADAAKDPLVCVWETKDGRLTHWITTDRLEDPVLALAFSGDGRYLLTGGESKKAQLWDLSARQGDLVEPAVTFSDPSVASIITCAAIRPGHAEQVVTGHRDGQVHLWKRDGGRGALEMPHLVAREFSTEVKALAFTPDGRYLAASGDGRRIWVGTMEPRPHRVDLLDRLGPHHDEQVNALIAWRGRGAAGRDRPILVSGSDDTTIRFWDLQERALRGTFSAGSRPGVPVAMPAPEVDWVLYTPEGLFDASAEATKLVHYRRPAPTGAAAPAGRGREPGELAVGLRRLEEAGQLDQLAATHSVYGLGERLMRGEIPDLKPKSEEAPPIAISAATRTDPTRPEARLTIALGSDEFQDVRLYHNDVPIPSGWAPGPGRDRRAKPLEVPVTLVGGSNRFYVMASRADAYDSCSHVVELDYQAPMERGRVHVLALGVTDYPNRPLRYPRDDAERLSEILNQRGLDAKGERGRRHVLYEADISPASVDRAFRAIARAVEDRPQDTVVVFLAGHTGVFAPQRFCLLLPSFPFPKEAAEPPPIQVAARDAGLEYDENQTVDPRFVLPYSVIEANLARLKALNRLVIVDACQAESILDDPKVRAIRKWVEVASRRARTSYLMAARRGEPALEVAPLQHGLFTYALLRGMRAVESLQEPKEVAALALPDNADFNGDHVISTDELDAYARQVLPRLSGVFPRLIAGRRNAVVPRNAPPQAGANPPFDQALRLEGGEASFPLIPLGEPARPR
jgi:WD40 repeat protein/uncharacterized caspase-like protein